jgi:hypothetical protein
MVRVPKRPIATPSGSGPLLGLRLSSVLLSWVVLNSALGSAMVRCSNSSPESQTRFRLVSQIVN